jgi:hypothetical protein
MKLSFMQLTENMHRTKVVNITSVYAFYNVLPFLWELLFVIFFTRGTRGSVVVKALCYKPEGRGFDTR